MFNGHFIGIQKIDVSSDVENDVVVSGSSTGYLERVISQSETEV
jgi:hypothetical protein